MPPVLATTLGFNDFAIIALTAIVFAVAAGAAYSARQKAGLRRIERKLDALLKQQGVPPPPPRVAGEISDEVQHLALDPAGRIEAIKLHREQTGCGLAEAKRDVDQFIKNIH
jgi:ribosomal protein L7/L12